MKTSTYFIEALQSGAYKKLAWVIDCFTVTEYPIFENFGIEYFYPYQLVFSSTNKDKLFFVDAVEKTITELSDYKPNTALIRFKDRITLQPNDLPNVKSVIETNYGNVFFNQYVLCYAFGSKIDFITGKIKGSQVEDLIAPRLKKYIPGEETTRDPAFIYVDELLKHNNAVSALEGLVMICAPSVTVETMRPSPGVIELRNKLFEKYKDDLDNPATIAALMKELVDYEKEQLKDTEASDFYLSGKSYDVIRAKRFLLYGVEGGFGNGKLKVIKSSLSEGWSMKNFPSLVDGARGAIYSRGKETAVGGEWVKHFQRVFQNIKIVEPDCKNQHGLSWTLTDYNQHRFVGLYRIVGGKPELLDVDTCKSLVGSTISVRSPMLCKTTPPNYCEVCCGTSISATPDALHSVTSRIGSIFMLVRMKKMHGKATVTRDYDVVNAIN